MRIINFRNRNLRFIEGEGGGDAGGGIVEGNTDTTGEVDNSGGEQQEQSSGRNPAWDPVLNLIPSTLHDGVTPHLREWDKNFQTELQKVQSQYEPYKPLIDSGAAPETLQAALNFYQMAEQDPQRVFEEMAKYYGFGQDQGQQEQVQSSDDEFNLDNSGEEQDPRYAALEKNQEAMAQMLLSQHNKEQEAQFEAEVEVEVTKIKTAHPDMSEDDELMMYRLAIANQSTLTQASDELFKYKESTSQFALQGKSQAPAVMNSTGTIPGQPPIDPRKLDSKDTKALVASIIANRQ